MMYAFELKVIPHFTFGCAAKNRPATKHLHPAAWHKGSVPTSSVPDSAPSCIHRSPLHDGAAGSNPDVLRLSGENNNLRFATSQQTQHTCSKVSAPLGMLTVESQWFQPSDIRINKYIRNAGFTQQADKPFSFFFYSRRRMTPSGCASKMRIPLSIKAPDSYWS